MYRFDCSMAYALRCFLSICTAGAAYSTISQDLGFGMFVGGSTFAGSTLQWVDYSTSLFVASGRWDGGSVGRTAGRTIGNLILEYCKQAQENFSGQVHTRRTYDTPILALNSGGIGRGLD